MNTRDGLFLVFLLELFLNYRLSFPPALAVRTSDRSAQTTAQFCCERSADVFVIRPHACPSLFDLHNERHGRAATDSPLRPRHVHSPLWHVARLDEVA